MRLLLFLSALLTGLTGLLPGTGPVGARQVAQAHAVAGAIAVAVAERTTAVWTIPEQPPVETPPHRFRADAPHVDVRARIDSARE